MIPMLDLKKEYELLRDEITSAIESVMAHQQWINGPEVKKFEEAISTFLGVKYAVGVNSGTDALVIALRSVCYKLRKEQRFKGEDEIITTPFTFTATGETILRSGATCVFADIDEDYNISPESIKKSITKKTIGILAVHLYGNPAKMDEINRIARENNLFVIEDVAQAFGSKIGDRYTGTLSDAGAFSFFPSKNLGAFGDGGMVVSNSDEIKNFSTYLRNHGGRDKYNVEFEGYNSRLDTIQAAILLVKLGHIKDFIERRRAVANRYKEGLKDISLLKMPEEREGGLHTYHQFTIRVLENKRDRLAELLKKNEISTMVYYPVLLNRMKVFEGRSRVYDELKNSDRFSKEVISLPIGPQQSMETTDKIIDAIRKVAREL